MVPEAQRLHAALVTAFPDHAARIYAEFGFAPDRALAASIETATGLLDADLAAEMELPFSEQRRSPMEIFRVALVAVAQGLDEPEAQPSSVAAPLDRGDPHGVGPASPSELGMEAHEALMAWGAAKAAALTGSSGQRAPQPTVLIVASDHAERELLASMVGSPGVACVTARNPGAVAAAVEQGSVILAVVDLGHRSAGDAIARLTEARITTVAYGDQVDDLTETGLLAQGVRMVVERDRFLARPRDYLPAIV